MFQKSKLNNGIRVITERIPSRTVAVGFWVNSGSRDESRLESGYAHFVEHMFFKGCGGFSAWDIARKLDRLGGNANAFTSRETTCLHATVLDDHVEELIALLAPMFFQPNFDHDETEREKQVILQEIDMVEDTPEDSVHDFFLAEMFPNHSLGESVLGRPATINELTGEQLRVFYKQHYHRDNLIISAAGSVDHASFIQLLEDAFLAFEEKRQDEGRKTRGPQRVKPQEASSFLASKSRSLEQSHVILGTYGLPESAEERFALVLLNLLLGGNMSSKLFQELREKCGLAYSVYSFADSFFDSGYLGVYTAVAPAKVIDAVGRVLTIIRAIGNQEITDDELENVKNYALASMYLAAESNEARMLRLAKNELIFGRYIPFPEIESRLLAVTKSDIAQLADQLLNRPLSAAILGKLKKGDQKKLERQLMH